MAADGSNVRRLTEGGDFTMPVWAPDGRSIAFRQGTAVESSIGVLAPDGGERVQLVPRVSRDAWMYPVVWLPGGGELLYSSGSEGGLLDLWVVSLSGGRGRRFLPEAEGERRGADVSAVHSRIVYAWTPTAIEGAQHGTGTIDLYLVDSPDQPNPVSLTAGRVEAPNTPRWSPDGTRVAFAGYPVGPDGVAEGLEVHSPENPGYPDSEIFIIDVLTLELTQVTDDGQDDFNPVWTPDGMSVVVASARDNVDVDIWRLSVDGSEPPVNLIDDAESAAEELMPDYFWGAVQLQ